MGNGDGVLVSGGNGEHAVDLTIFKYCGNARE